MKSTRNLMIRYNQPVSASARLLCFPYAGGGASIFADWTKFLPVDIEVIGIQLPGRETRINDYPFSDLAALVAEVTEELRYYSDLPMIFFGHSMGALISFEVTRRLRHQNMPQPVHLFVSSFRAPQLKDNDPPIRELPDDQFIRELQKLGGTPAEVTNYPELLELLVPVTRKDIALCENYRYTAEPPLSCSISVFAGENDSKLGRYQLQGWKKQTNNSFEIKMFNGDHFFFHGDKQAMLQSMSYKLNQLKKTLYNV